MIERFLCKFWPCAWGTRPLEGSTIYETNPHNTVMSELYKFIFDGMPVRGMLVRLSTDWQEVLRRRLKASGWPQPVRHLLGEMAAAATLMQSSVQFNGALIFQIFGDGPLKLAAVEVQADLAFRVTAKVIGEVSDSSEFSAMVDVSGQGRCAVILDAFDRHANEAPYQGVVPLRNNGQEPLAQLSDALSHYMRQSEQLDSVFVLAANDDLAVGLLIQRMPVEGEANVRGRQLHLGSDDDFKRITYSLATLQKEEMLSLDAKTILRRLFWDEPLRYFEPQYPRFQCRCSREKVNQMLFSLGVDEVQSILKEQGHLDIGCEFCGLAYTLDTAEANTLLMTPPQSGISF